MMYILPFEHLQNFQLLSPLFTNINSYLCANHLHVYLHLITTYHLPISLINMTNPLHDMSIITYYPTYPPTNFTHKIYPPQNLLESESGVSWGSIYHHHGLTVELGAQTVGDHTAMAAFATFAASM
jgi:hypothetical protein